MKVKEESAKEGLYLNKKKKNPLITEEIHDFSIDNEVMETVNDFITLIQSSIQMGTAARNSEKTETQKGSNGRIRKDQ